MASTTTHGSHSAGGADSVPALPKHRRASVVRTAYAYILPAAIVMLIITFLPLLYQVWLSLTNYSNLNLRLPTGSGIEGLLGQIVASFNPALQERYNGPSFVGLANYARILGNGLSAVLSGFEFWRILLFNLLWTAVNVFFHVVLGVAIAMLLNVQGLWFKRFYRAMFIIPWAMPGLVAAMVWRNMFDPDSGSVNVILRGLGLPGNTRWLLQVDPPFTWLPPFIRVPAGVNPWFMLFLFMLLLVGPFLYRRRLRQPFLRNFIVWFLILEVIFGLLAYPVLDTLRQAMGRPSAAVASVSLGQLFPLSFYATALANIWLGWPFMMAVATGGLQSIPHDLYEASSIDGATGWQTFWAITVPLLRPAMVPAIMIGTMMTFNQFNVIYFISGGGPLHSTEILVTEAYRLVNETTINLVGLGNVRPYGVAAAFAYIVFFVLAAITLITNRVSRATESYNA